MCGAFYLRQSPSLASYYGLDTLRSIGDMERREVFDPRRVLDGVPVYHVVRPTDEVLIIAQSRAGHFIMESAAWWLLMKAEEGGELVPNQEYATFNSRIDKVLTAGQTLHNSKPKSFRVLIPASGYFEWLGRVPYDIARADGETILFGGVAKAYRLPGGGFKLGASIVTLPGHPKLAHIHGKSLPLMIEDSQIAHWLDRTVTHQDLQEYTKPSLKHALIAQPRSDMKQPELFGDAEYISAD